MTDYDFAACRRLAATVLIAGIEDASNGCPEARAWLATDRAGLFADVNGIGPARLKGLAANIESVDLEQAKKLMRARPPRRKGKLTRVDKKKDYLRARKILSQDPDLTGVSLAKRLGRSSSYGQQLKRRILSEQQNPSKTPDENR